MTMSFFTSRRCAHRCFKGCSEHWLACTWDLSSSPLVRRSVRSISATPQGVQRAGFVSRLDQIFFTMAFLKACEYLADLDPSL